MQIRSSVSLGSHCSTDGSEMRASSAPQILQPEACIPRAHCAPWRTTVKADSRLQTGGGHLTRRIEALLGLYPPLAAMMILLQLW